MMPAAAAYAPSTMRSRPRRRWKREHEEANDDEDKIPLSASIHSPRMICAGEWRRRFRKMPVTIATRDEDARRARDSGHMNVKTPAAMPTTPGPIARAAVRARFREAEDEIGHAVDQGVEPEDHTRAAIVTPGHANAITPMRDD